MSALMMVLMLAAYASGETGAPSVPEQALSFVPSMMEMYINPPFSFLKAFALLMMRLKSSLPGR